MNPINKPLRRRRDTKLLHWLFLVLLCAAFSVTGCGSGDSAGDADQSADSVTANSGDGDVAQSDTTKSDEKPKKKKRERTTSINAAKVIRGDLVIPVVAEGTIRARQSADIRTEINGRIVKISAREGQRVRKGSLILKLDSREYQVAAQEARSRYLQALSVLAIEEDSVDVIERSSELTAKIKELEKLEDSGAISREERLAREVALDVEELKNGAFRVDMVAVRSGVTAARMDLEKAYLKLEQTEIRAPFNGVISGLTLSEGEHVVTSQTVCTLVNNTNLEAQVGVLESDIGNVQQGRPALLALPALGDTIRVEVDVVSPQFDRNSRTCDVLLRLKDPSGRVKPGMFVRAIIAGERFEDRMLVPRESILTRDGRPLLFKVEGDRAKWLYLKTGRQNDFVVEVEGVLQGGSLNPGDRVVVSNHLTLSHDAKIKVKKTIPIGDPWGGKK